MRHGNKKLLSRQLAKRPEPLYPLKVKIAQELGLLDKVRQVGWGNLTSAESGRIGGWMTRRLGRKPPRNLRLLPGGTSNTSNTSPGRQGYSTTAAK